MFLDSRLEKKEEEIGEVLQALDEKKDKCKSLETRVWANDLLCYQFCLNLSLSPTFFHFLLYCIFFSFIVGNQLLE